MTDGKQQTSFIQLSFCNNTAALLLLSQLIQLIILMSHCLRRVVFLYAAVEIIADTIYNSTFADSDIDVEKANVLKELEVSLLCKC